MQLLVAFSGHWMLRLPSTVLRRFWHHWSREQKLDAVWLLQMQKARVSKV